MKKLKLVILTLITVINISAYALSGESGGNSADLLVILR
jgi:hypothetical protein